ncbi:hypothetical protein [Methylocapsa palsarum]|uniref:Ribbon-helix-helix protein, copG family n=1 Tax=Methylocapsa palsarum TaxID=1612308 RepID=A0A1I4C4H1_9HYPH|nr:hypothetical protein [Methylocapsa palsarum]SFK75287.1 hypothetical protein SAMN05444581_1183 [Methylocapsa palsarum]
MELNRKLKNGKATRDGRAIVTLATSVSWPEYVMLGEVAAAHGTTRAELTRQALREKVERLGVQRSA